MAKPIALLTLTMLLLWSASARADESFVFVHENRTVALHQAGKADLILFGKGREPALSPDGKRVFYWSEPGGASLMLAEVGGPPSVWRPGNLRSPQFSPDGKSVLWGEMSGDWGVMISPIDPPAPRLLFGNKLGVFHPAWQPDGKGIIAADLDRLYFVGLDGKIQRSVPIVELAGASGVSSSDRFRQRPGHPQQLLFSAEVNASPALEKKTHGEGSSALFLYDLDQKTRTRLTPADAFVTDPAWSADGMFIYARGFRVGAHPLRDGILRMSADGQNLERVAPGSEPGTAGGS